MFVVCTSASGAVSVPMTVSLALWERSAAWVAWHSYVASSASSTEWMNRLCSPSRGSPIREYLLQPAERHAGPHRTVTKGSITIYCKACTSELFFWRGGIIYQADLAPHREQVRLWSTVPCLDIQLQHMEGSQTGQQPQSHLVAVERNMRRG